MSGISLKGAEGKSPFFEGKRDGMRVVSCFCHNVEICSQKFLAGVTRPGFSILLEMGKTPFSSLQRN